MQLSFEDEERSCRDCKGPFTFTAGEQQFFSERGFTPPHRCKPCRELRKAANANGPQRQQPQNGGNYSRTPAEPIREYRSRTPRFEPQAPVQAQPEPEEYHRRRRSKHSFRHDDNDGVEDY